MTDPHEDRHVIELCHHGVAVVAAFEELLLSGRLRVVDSLGSSSIVRELRARCAPGHLPLRLTGDGLVISVPTLSGVWIEASGPVSVVADGTTCGTVSGRLTLSLGTRTQLVPFGTEVAG